MPALCSAHALGLHLLFQLQILFQPVAPREHLLGGLDVPTADGHRRRQPVTPGLDLGDFFPAVAAAQAIVALLTDGTQFRYFSLFSTDKVRNIPRCVQLFLADQLRLTANPVQTAALLPEFWGEGAVFAPFGQDAQAAAIVEVQSPEAADLPYCAERAFHTVAIGTMSLDGHGLVPLIAQVVGVPLAVFLNAFPEGGEVVVLPQPLQPHRLFTANAPQGGVFVGGVGVQLVALLSEGFPQVAPIHADLECGVQGLPHQVVFGGFAVLFHKVNAPGRFAFWIFDRQ